MPGLSFGFYDIFETGFGSSATGGAVELVTCQIRRAGEEEGVDARDVEIWGHYGFTSRPAAPDGAKRCQTIAADIGGRKVALWTSDVRGSEHFGKLSAGDVALWSVGKNALRLNNDGSIAAINRTNNADSLMMIEKNGQITMLNEWGKMTLGPEGFSVVLSNGAMFSLTKTGFTVQCQQLSLNTSSVGLGVGAAVPLSAVFLPIPGSKVVPNVFV